MTGWRFARVPAAEELPADDPVDRLVDWLIGGLDLDSTTFHVGQYCGPWHASTAGQGRASFHLVLRGNCYLHLAGCEPVPLRQGDAVFLLRDLPHSLRPDREGSRDGARAPRPMLPMQPVLEQATSLACGFFEFRGRFTPGRPTGRAAAVLPRTRSPAPRTDRAGPHRPGTLPAVHRAARAAVGRSRAGLVGGEHGADRQHVAR